MNAPDWREVAREMGFTDEALYDEPTEWLEDAIKRSTAYQMADMRMQMRALLREAQSTAVGRAYLRIALRIIRVLDRLSATFTRQADR